MAEEKLLQWHAAFFAGLQIELEEEAEYLIFENEHMLSTKPMQVDVLVIKKNSERAIQKNIGQIFRKHNIIEYKSPDDYLSIDDFYKVNGYACFYKADTKKADEIKADEVTISFVCSHYPRELMRHFNEEVHYSVSKKEAGIYYVLGHMFPVQILVSSELSEENNLWLKHLTNDLPDVDSAERLVRAYEKKQNNRLYSSVMDIVVRANPKKFEEVRNMCDALRELMKDDIQQWLKEATEQGLQQGLQQGAQQEKENLIRKKILKNKTLEQIAEELEIYPEEIQSIYNRLKEEIL